MALKMEQSYLQNHYEIFENEYGYQFTTVAGVDYYLTFLTYPTVSDFLSTRIYMFNIDRANDQKIEYEGQDDVKVRNTILYVLEKFFYEHEDALITICDVIDGKQFARKRLFDSWFQKFNDNRLVKLDAQCLIDDIPTFVSLLFSIKHFDQEGLQREFSQLVEINFYS